jgi:putative tricarboxylic transport membrane protein
MEGKSRGREKATAAVLLGLSILYLFSSLRLRMGNLRNPGPSLIPAVIGGLLLLCTTVYLIRVFRPQFRGGERGDTAPKEEKNYRAIVGIVACTTVYPFVLESLKFILSTWAAAFVMLVLMKPQKPLRSFVLAVAMSAGSFLVFSRLLGVALPSGFLEELVYRLGR